MWSMGLLVFLCIIRPRKEQDIVREALSRVGEVGYNVLFNNCEHFATYCRYGVKGSEQVCHFWNILIHSFHYSYIGFKFLDLYQLIFSSTELKAQVSFSDHNLSVVRR